MRPIAIWDGLREAWENPHGSVDLFSTHSDVYLETWPPSGMTRGGLAFVLPMPELPTVGSVSSFLPTPVVTDSAGTRNATAVRSDPNSKHHSGVTLTDALVPVLPTPRASRGASGTETMYALGAERDDSNRTQGQVVLKNLPTPNAYDAMKGGSQHPDKRRGGGHQPSIADVVEHLLPTPAAMNPNDGESVETWEARRVATKARVKNGNGFGTPLAIAVQLLPTPTTQDAANTGGGITVRPEQSSVEHAGSDTAWGDYGPAIFRWETVTGRPAPAPTLPDGRDGAHRLSAAFVEWLMGLKEGHVTDSAIGLSRNEQLKALGNGVVWQQAALALRLLLAVPCVEKE